MEPEATIGLAEAAERLGVHYMTAYRYVRTGRLPATRAGAEWRVRPADVDALAAPTAEPAPKGRRRRTDYRARLEEHLVAGDEAGAWNLISQALTSTMSPSEVYTEALAPAMRSIGDRWEQGELTVAEEHCASAVAHRLVGRMGPQFVKRGRRRGTIVLGTVPGDHHALPTALLADLLRERSFSVIDLGADTPCDSFVETAVSADRLLAVGVSMTAPDLDDAAAETIEAVRRATDAPVVLGGSAVPDEATARRLGADGWAPDGPGAVDLFLSLTAR